MMYLQHNLQDAIYCGARSLDKFNQSLKATLPLIGTLKSNLINKHSLLNLQVNNSYEMIQNI